MESIKNRTTIRKYSNREVSDELLHRLIEEAERTPTMGNLQLYSVVVTRSEEGKKALAPAHFNQPMVTDASVVLTIAQITDVQPSGQRTARAPLVMTISYHS